MSVVDYVSFDKVECVDVVRKKGKVTGIKISINAKRDTCIVEE